MMGNPKQRDTNMPKKTTKDQFTKKAQTVHGDTYDYSAVNYINAKTKVTIICPEHGAFEQTPSNHLSGSGCPTCAFKATSKLKTRIASGEYLNRLKAIHGERYDYAKTVYTRAHDKVTITCPVHGDFQQTAVNHLKGSGCVKCGRQYKPTTKEFIKKAKTIHGGRFDYSKTVYVNSQKKISIICPVHGEFEQTPNSHLSGRGCACCAHRAMKKRSK